MTSLTDLMLANGVTMPRIGLGTWPLDDAGAADAVNTALAAGYRLIDTAENYRNEAGVGEGIRRSGVPRAEIFVTSKFNREWHSVDGAARACDASLEQAHEAGKVRAIGTSNFKPAHLKRLFAAGFVPHVNQIQLDPWHPREEVALHREHGIVTESWSPLGRGRAMLADPAIVAVAERIGRTPAQVVLRWHVQSGYVPVPKSADPVRQADNLAVFDFALTDADMASIAALGRRDAEMLDADTFGH